MQAKVQKSISTTLPRNASADSGGELSQVVAPERSGSRPSTGSAAGGAAGGARSVTAAVVIAELYETCRNSFGWSPGEMGCWGQRPSNSWSDELPPPAVNPARHSESK